MTPDKWERVKEILLLAQSSPIAEREALLERMAEGDREVLAEVRSLLRNATGASVTEAGPANPLIVIHDRYVVESVLGRGGFATTYLARDKALDQRRVAVKVLDRPGSDELSDQGFEVELKALASLVHPGVVQPLDSGRIADGRRFIVIQFIDGYSLRSVIESGGLDFARVAGLVRKIGGAMYAVQQKGISHRDLKPENIMVQLLPDGSEQPRIIDFGIARTLPVAESAAFTMHVMGTLRYMAPEQLEGRISRSTDIFSLAVLTYEMLTGETPFPANTQMELLRLQMAGAPAASGRRPGISGDVDGILHQALSMDPAKRPQDIGAFAESVASALEVKPTQERKSRRTLVLGLGALCIAVAGGLTVREVMDNKVPPPSIPVLRPAVKRRLFMAILPVGERSYARLSATADAYVIHGPFRLRFTTEEDGNLYLFSEAGQSWNILFPSPNANGGSSRIAGREMVGQRLEFDGRSKRTRLWVVWSRGPVEALEDAKRWMNARDRGAIGDEKARSSVRAVLAESAGPIDLATGEIVGSAGKSLLAVAVWMDPARTF